jgi:menaquinone-specific isochorismate synthase
VIAGGEAEKVVLARDLAGTVPAGSDLRRLVRALSSGYPDCWTFAVDGLVGASPETLVTVSGGTVTARVLAGTAPRGADADADTEASLTLATSAKDLDEHEYAVQSVLASLRPHTSALAASEQPFTLKLPNVWHLATDVEGELADSASALDLLSVLHPTAAVAGTPTDAAVEVIRRLEPFDRGRYAGPVGWVGANGDGEWAIALRCAQFDLHAMPAGSAEAIPVTAHAGAGIVAGSDPESEMLETRVKFRPIVDALA